MRTQAKVAIGVGAAVVVILLVLGIQAGSYATKVGDHDEAAASMVGRYQSARGAAYGSVPTLKALDSFIQVSADVWSETPGRAATAREMEGSKTLLQKMVKGPEYSERRLDEFQDGVATDMAGLVTQLAKAVTNSVEDTRQTLVGPAALDMSAASARLRDETADLRSARNLLASLQPFRNEQNGKQFDQVDTSIRSGLAQVNDFARSLRIAADRRATAMARVQAALSDGERANQRLQAIGQFARASDIRPIASTWSSVESTVTGANQLLRSKAGYPSAGGATLALKVLANDIQGTEKVAAQVGSHEGMVTRTYRQAVAEESTVTGSLQRAGGRLLQAFGRKANAAAQTRMGREAGVAVKTLVLGTKMLFDLVTMDPNTDLMGWASSYDSDLNQLMYESDEIRRMDGPSFTGKNTPIETLINGSYERAFNKPSGG